MNIVCLGGDLFTLYVAMELLTFAAVPMVSLDGRAGDGQGRAALSAFAVAGSVFYLLGMALLYGLHGTLDIEMLSRWYAPICDDCRSGARRRQDCSPRPPCSRCTLWLPPAHAGAPAAGKRRAVGLVVKGSFFLTIRLWFDAVPGLPQRKARCCSAASAQPRLFSEASWPCGSNA